MSTEERLARLEHIATLTAETGNDQLALLLAARRIAAAAATVVCCNSSDPMRAMDQLRHLAASGDPDLRSELAVSAHTELERLLAEVEIAVTVATRLGL